MDQDRVLIILVSARNPLNIGAAARAMCNFGFHRLRVVNPYDVAFRDARSAVGASSVLTDAEIFSSVAEAVADCTLVVGTTAVKQRLLQHPQRTLAQAAPWIGQEISSNAPHNRQVAILFGSEKFGLSNKDMSHCNWLMHIPTSDRQPSMNLGQAVAVCLYELIRADTKAHESTDPPPASSGELERMTSVLLDTLHASGYMETRPANDKEETVRRLVRRLNVSSEDSATWLGILRQIAWKLRKDTPS